MKPIANIRFEHAMERLEDVGVVKTVWPLWRNFPGALAALAYAYPLHAACIGGGLIWWLVR